jgi:hypothetical protein
VGGKWQLPNEAPNGRLTDEADVDLDMDHSSARSKGENMPPLKLVGLAGSYSPPSKSRTLVEEVSALASERYGFRRRIYDLHDAGPFLGQAQRYEDLDPNGRQLIEDIIAANVLVVGSPTWPTAS